MIDGSTPVSREVNNLVICWRGLDLNRAMGYPLVEVESGGTSKDRRVQRKTVFNGPGANGMTFGIGSTRCWRVLESCPFRRNVYPPLGQDQMGWGTAPDEAAWNSHGRRAQARY